MAVRGPAPNLHRRRRNIPVHDWYEVENVPYEDGPKLPAGTWPTATKAWWRAISRMPHCVLWEDSDWQFAFSAAILARAFHRGDLRAGSELMRWEKVMGTTIDARRALRIRYVEPTQPEERKPISSLENYRQMMRSLTEEA